ncbi:hypothetical protein [Nostoc sp.]|uniref:hypothetical protein n=1 Tax=Nostoc sp. TaxID=1180 RepID=UPI002FF7097C
MTIEIIQQQIDYYRNRATEYDEWFYRIGRYERGEKLNQQWFAEYDLVFFSFWLSHVPPNLLNSFLQKVYQSVRLGGQIFIIDSRFEPTSTAKNHLLQDDRNIYKLRKLNNGQEFAIVKVFYQADELQEHLEKIGFQAQVNVTDNYFIYANCQKI